MAFKAMLQYSICSAGASSKAAIKLLPNGAKPQNFLPAANNILHGKNNFSNGH